MRSRAGPGRRGSSTSAQPALEHLHDRALRQRLWRAAVARGRRDGPHDNRAVVCEIAALRAERAGLLGFGSHAEYALADQTAGSVAAVMDHVAEVGRGRVRRGTRRGRAAHRGVARRDAHVRERGHLYVDPFARDGKGGGAWMESYADPAPLIGRRPSVSLVLDATRPADGAPVLLTPLDVRILFHEFGHALHMLLSDVAFLRIAGINVPEDVVEFPSKFHESLAVRPDVLARSARHHATGAPLPDADAEALAAFIRDGAAYISTQGAANALLDQAWHSLAPGESVAPDGVDAFEAAVLERHGLALRAVGLHYRSTFFTHVFDGHYAGTHYAYLWSAMLEAIALDWLDAKGGLTRAAGQRLRDEVFSRGAVVDPVAALRAVTGRTPSVGPLLARRGLR